MCVCVYTSPTPTLPVPEQSNYFFLLFFPLPLLFFSTVWKKIGSPRNIYLYYTGYRELFSLFVGRDSYLQRK